MKTKRKYYQIYEDFEALAFDGEAHTRATLRAAILEGLATHGFREFNPNNKQDYDYLEDVLRLQKPEAELKYGISHRAFYLQTSVSDQKELAQLHSETVELIKKWEKGR